MFIKMIKDNVPKVSQSPFPKWQIPKCAISQAATFQVCPSRSAGSPNVSAAPNPFVPCGASKDLIKPSTFGKWPLRKLHIWKIAAWEIAQFGSGHLSNCHLGSRL